MKRIFWNILSLALAFTGCTSNPVGDGETPQPNLEISGTVRLSNDDDPRLVYIWFDALKLAQRPDAFGNFKFTLPPPDAQSTAGGLNGAFGVNFYIANFNFVVKTVIIRNGEFLYETADLDANGRIFPEAFLDEQLRVRTVIDPPEVTIESDSVSFAVQVNLHAFKDTVEIFFPRMVDGLSAPLLLRNMQNEAVTIVPTTITNIDTTDFKKIATELITREMSVQISAADFAAGEYEVIPYILVLNEAVPDELIASIGEGVQELGASYLKLPFIRREGRLRISEKGDP